MLSCQTGIIPFWSTSGERMKGLDVGYGVLCHPFDLRRAGSINNSTGVGGVVGVKSCAKRNRNFSQLLLPLANQNDVRFTADSVAKLFLDH
jgi:hypothetical protein